MSYAVFCTVPSLTQTNAIVGQLEETGFRDGDVSVLLPDWHHRDGHLSGAAGRLHLRVVLIAGIGRLIGAGSVMDALSGESPSTLTGALDSLGLGERDAKLYEERIREGNVFVCARARGMAERDHAESVFHMAGAYDIVVGLVDHEHTSTPLTARGERRRRSPHER